jgi:hypothetical protein
MPTKKQHDDPAQLLLRLQEAGHALDLATKNYVAARSAVAAIPLAAQVADTVEQEQRALFNRLVRHLAVGWYGSDFHVAYIATYQELSRATGYHPATEATSAKSTHLDKVVARGLLDKAIDAVKRILATPPPPRLAPPGTTLANPFNHQPYGAPAPA